MGLLSRVVTPLFVPLAICFVGCHVPYPPCAYRKTSDAHLSIQFQHSKLTSNEVVRIAQHAVQRAGYDMIEYNGVQAFFGAPGSKTNWTVYVGKTPPVPDDFILVIIDDETGAFRLIIP
jgi:hypothetical protein